MVFSIELISGFTKFSKEYSIIGIAYKDSEKMLISFLWNYGNPYQKIFT